MLDQTIALAREELKTKGFLGEDPHLSPNSMRMTMGIGTRSMISKTRTTFSKELLPAGKATPQPSYQTIINSSEEDFDDDDWDDEDGKRRRDCREPLTAEALGHVVYALSAIADPLARDAIMSAFDEGLVDEYVVTRNDVVEEYEKDEDPREEDPGGDWLSVYREDYAEHLESLRTPSPPPKPATIPRPKYRYEDRYDEGEPPADIPVTEPIRNTGPRVGRNDPCWCGSGKKYKKCHLGKDTTD